MWCFTAVAAQWIWIIDRNITIFDILKIFLLRRCDFENGILLTVVYVSLLAWPRVSSVLVYMGFCPQIPCIINRPGLFLCLVFLLFVDHLHNTMACDTYSSFSSDVKLRLTGPAFMLWIMVPSVTVCAPGTYGHMHSKSSELFVYIILSSLYLSCYLGALLGIGWKVVKNFLRILCCIHSYTYI